MSEDSTSIPTHVRSEELEVHDKNAYKRGSKFAFGGSKAMMFVS